jgi:hypothetical protein
MEDKTIRQLEGLDSHKVYRTDIIYLIEVYALLQEELEKEGGAASEEVDRNLFAAHNS